MDFDSEFIEREKGVESDGDSDHPLAHVAAASGDVPLLVKAVQHDPGVIQQLDKDGYTPLAHAVHGQHLNVVKRLVKMGADVNAQDSQGRTYIAIAAYQGWPEGVLYLLRKGAKQTIVDKAGRTPLHAATYDVDSRSLVALLKRLSVKDINAMDNERMTALHWAAFHDRPENVRQLLCKGANILAQDIDGKTALHWAVQNGSRNCCLLLAEHGLSFGLLTTLDNSSKNAIHLAAAAGKALIITDIAKLLPDLLEGEDKDKRTPLHWAAAMGHGNCVKVLLEYNVTANSRDIDGATPLQYARQAKHTLCVSILEDAVGVKRSQKGKSNNYKSSDAKNSSSTGFFKGLFGRKEKHKDSKEDKSEKKRYYLPDMNVDIKVTQRTEGSDVNKGSTKTTSITQASNRYSRVSSSALRDNKLTENDSYNVDITDNHLTREQLEYKKRRKKHKRRTDSDCEGYSSPNTAKSSSTWSEGDYYSPKSPNFRSTHLSPIGNIRPPSMSPRLNIPTPDLILPMKRQGELSPLRLDRPDSEKMRSPLPKQLNQLREPSKRTPTPPPFKTPLRKKALPEISPLTQDMGSLQMDTEDINYNSRKPYSIRPETEIGGSLTPDTPEILANNRKLAKVSEESDHGNLNINSDGFDGTFPRYPSDDAISLYKLSNNKANKFTMLDDGEQEDRMT